MDDGVKLAIKAAGGLRPLARLVGVTHASVTEWDQVPMHHVFVIEEKLDLRREELRPDIFLHPRPQRRRA